MSAPRDWLATFDDPAVLADLFEAARSYTRDGCVHQHRHNGTVTEDPDFCDCRENQIGPIEFAQWVEQELHHRRRRGRAEPAGRPGRRKPDLLLAVASG